MQLVAPAAAAGVLLDTSEAGDNAALSLTKFGSHVIRSFVLCLLAAIVTSAFASDAPSEAEARRQVEAVIHARFGDRVKVNAFRKTNGLPQTAGGVPAYGIEFEAELGFAENCNHHYSAVNWGTPDPLDCARGQPRSQLESNSQIFASRVYGRIKDGSYAKGQKVALSGTAWFRRTESGWAISQ